MIRHPEFSNLQILDHPLILHKLTHMRKVDTSTRTFRTLLKEISRLGCRRGLAVNPKTPVDGILPWLEHIDLALVMSVEPGFGGQSFMPEVLPKVRRLRQAIDTAGLQVDVEIDGGVGPTNAAMCRDAGARWLVAGSAVFRAEDPAAAIQQIRSE